MLCNVCGSFAFQICENEPALLSVFLVSEGLHDLCFQLLAQFGIVFQQLFHRITALCQFASIVREPRPTLLNNAVFYTKIYYFSHFRDTFTKHYLKFTFTEGRCDLVLYYFHTHLIANHFVSILYTGYPTDIKTDRGIKLQGIATCRCLRIAKHYTDFLAQLVNKDTSSICF